MVLYVIAHTKCQRNQVIHLLLTLIDVHLLWGPQWLPRHGRQCEGFFSDEKTVLMVLSEMQNDTLVNVALCCHMVT